MSNKRRFLAALSLASALYGCAGQHSALETGKQVEVHNDKEDANFGSDSIEEILQYTVLVENRKVIKEDFANIVGVEISSTRPVTYAGTGLALCNDYVLTANHVIRKKSKYKVISSRIFVEDKYKAEVVKKEPWPVDLALLKVSCEEKVCLKPYTNGFTEKLEKGDFIAGIGRALGRETLFTGHVDDYYQIEGYGPQLMVETRVFHGDSGSPVFNYHEGNSRFIGLVHLTSKDKNRHLAGITLPLVVKKFLENTEATACWENEK